MSQPHPLVKAHRWFIATKNAIIALLWIGVCGVCLSSAWTILSIALAIGNTTITIICGTAALLLALYGLDKVFSHLPLITPRRISDAPGRSRLAERDEQRRGRII